MNRAIVHVDMDAFYASVEQRDHPELRGKPVIVGGHARRGVVLAASYEVRKFGVRSAMPMAWAVQRAPHAIVVPPRPSAYAEASESVFEIFASVTPLIEPLSLDEAFLDVTASVKLFGSPWQIAEKLRARIAEEVQLPSSAGIAATKFVAKIASDLAKPNGQREIPAERTRELLAPLPISRLWGVGPKTEQTLVALGLKTIGDVAARDKGWLFQKLGDGGTHLWELSQGIDDRPVIPDAQAKSIGAEDTFEEDVEDREALHPQLHLQALRVGRRLRRSGHRTRVVQLKIKFHDFETITRRVTLEAPTDDGQTLYRAALGLLERVPAGKKVRLTGVSAQDLDAPPPQLSLFAPAGPSRSDKLNAALDKIAQKYGTAAVVPADVAPLTPRDDEEDEDRRQMGSSRLDTQDVSAPRGPRPSKRS